MVRRNDNGQNTQEAKKKKKLHTKTKRKLRTNENDAAIAALTLGGVVT